MDHGATSFDDDGRPVPSVDFDYDAIDGASEPPELDADAVRRIEVRAIAKLLRVLLDGARSPEQVGRNVFGLAYRYKLDCAPGTVRELAEIFGVSQTRVRQTCEKIAEKLPKNG
jgi:DNA-directed RNA polymerase specialized sigma subunit